MAYIVNRLLKLKTFVLKRFNSKIEPIEDNISSSQTTSVSQNSLNERNVNNYRRDSFEDRFCDDLCEDILQFLPLEDKLRLKYVSKQFQRTLFQRQFELYINVCSPDNYKSHLNCKDFRNRNHFNYYYIKKSDKNLDSFKALLKNCPKITSIQINGVQRGESEYGYNQIEAFRLIIENCNNLSEINILNYFKIFGSNLEEFSQKLGPKLKYLRFQFPDNLKLTDFNRFPNIEKIEINCLNLNYIISHLKLAKLKKLELSIGRGEEQLLQKVFFNFPTLTHLNLLIIFSDENAIYKSLKNISNLKHLIHFRIDIWENTSNHIFNYNNYLYDCHNNLICGLLEEMANNCRNLKSIECGFIISHQISDIRQSLSKLNAFPSLRRLNLWFHIDYEDGDNIDVNQLFSFELFKGFENITHLSLRFVWKKSLKVSILNEIDNNLPNLQYLYIRSEYSNQNYFETTADEATQMADILSRLSRLETLKLSFEYGFDYKPFKDIIIEKCRKIRKIQIKTINSCNVLIDIEINDIPKSQEYCFVCRSPFLD